MLDKYLKLLVLENQVDRTNYKSIGGKIEDFFKLCNSELSLKILHKYTPESAKRTIILTVFLTGIIVTLGYNSKKALQKLLEKGKI